MIRSKKIKVLHRLSQILGICLFAVGVGTFLRIFPLELDSTLTWHSVLFIVGGTILYLQAKQILILDERVRVLEDIHK